MRQLIHLVVAATIFAVTSSVARADDPRCKAPPYGGSVASYQAFVKYFNQVRVAGKVVDTAKVLSELCNVKFGHADRAKLYKLGFTDLEFATKDTEELGAHLITAELNSSHQAK